MGGLGGLLGDIGRSGIASDIINYENMRTNRAQQQWQNEQERLTAPLKIEALRQENEMRSNAIMNAKRQEAQRAEQEKFMKTPRPLDDLLGGYAQYIPEQTMGNIKRALMKAGIAEPISGPDGQQVLMASPWKLKAGFESIPGAEKWAEQMIQAAYVENIGILKKKKEQLAEYSDPIKKMENPQKFQALQEEVQKYQTITDKMTPYLSTDQQKFIQQRDMLEAKAQDAQEKMVMVNINGQNVPMTAAQYQQAQLAKERNDEIARHNKETEETRKMIAGARNTGGPAGGTVYGKPPMGYRYTQDGNLEPVPGGPADMKVKAAERKEILQKWGIEKKADLVIGKIDEAKKKAGGLETGLSGSIVKKIPGTQAYDLSKVIEMIKANIGFSELNAMRQASPTGGALGQVAVQELDFLQAALGSLDQAQSRGELLKNLEAIKTHFQNWKKTVETDAQGQTTPNAGVNQYNQGDWKQFLGGQ